MRVLFAVLALSLVACGGSDPEAEATWETHTTTEGESAGGEEERDHDEPADAASE